VPSSAKAELSEQLVADLRSRRPEALDVDQQRVRGDAPRPRTTKDLRSGLFRQPSADHEFPHLALLSSEVRERRTGYLVGLSLSPPTIRAICVRNPDIREYG